MKITDVQAVYPNYRQPLGGWRPYLWQIVVRVETDAGVTGYGCGGGGVAAVEVVNRHLRELLLDEPCDSPADIERLWDTLYTASIPYGRGGIAIMALSGIDLALWDLLGRAERQPVYALLGGSSAPRIRAYASGDDPAWFAERGFTPTRCPLAGHRTHPPSSAPPPRPKNPAAIWARTRSSCSTATWPGMPPRRARWRARWPLTTSTGSRIR